MRFLGFLLFVLLVNISTTCGMVSTIAVSGDAVPGVALGQFDSFDRARINAVGDGVFTAILLQGLGGVTADDDTAVFKLDGNAVTLLAREGGNVPTVAGTSFSSFSQVAIDDQGNTLVRGMMAQTGGVTSSNNHGLWRYSTSGDTLLARTDSQNVPGIPSANFETLPIEGIPFSGDGRAAFSSSLLTGGGVGTGDNRGLWNYQDNAGTLVSRKGTSPVPGVPVATFNNYGVPAINDNNQIVVTAVLNTGGSVTTNNRNGIWKFSDTTGTLIARTGMSDAPGLGGISFTTLSDAVINNSGQVAFKASGSVANSNGVWLYTNDVGELLARGGSGVVPDIPDANFDVFRDPVLSDTGHAVFAATLLAGPGGITSANDKGLWIMNNSNDDHLLLRSGSGNVPGITDANFLQFDTYAINEAGIVALTATLETGPGDVTTGNDTGLWLIDPAGSNTLIAREGDSLAGRTISSLSFANNSGGSDGRPTGLNQLNQLLFQATFTNGDAGLFLYTPSSTGTSPGDFDLDGDVDGRDFLIWQRGGSPNSLSASDLADWQAYYGTGPLVSALRLPPAAEAASPVPEPSVWSLLAVALCFSQGRTRGQPPHTC